MLLVPRKKARESYKRILDERRQRRRKEREEYFRQLYGPDIDVKKLVK